MNKIWIIIGIVVAVLVVGGLVVKKIHNAHHGMHGGKMITWMAEKVAKKLDLTDEQKSRLDALVKEYQPRFEEIHTQHRDSARKIAAEFRKDTLTREALEALHQNQNQPDIHELIYDFLAEFHAILTPEQRDQAADHVLEHMERHNRHQ